MMDLRNRVGLYGSYFLGMAGIGFTLPFLPLYLAEKGLSDRQIGVASTLAALAGLVQFPIGLWSDRIGSWKPFLVAALAALAVATYLLPRAHGVLALTLLVVFFAENGVARSLVESLSGAEAASLARPDQLASAIGRLRVWKPLGIVLVALLGGLWAERHGIASLLPPLVGIQAAALAAACLLHEGVPREGRLDASSESPATRGLADPTLWCFVAAMVLFHTANAPAGVYLGLFLKRSLNAPDRTLSYAFVVSMLVWMSTVWPAGRWADRVGRRPLLLTAWGAMTLRLALLVLARTRSQVIAVQALDGLANGLFAVVAAAWVIDRLGDHRRAGTAQVIVGASLVLGSAIGPAASGLIVDAVGYRTLFGLLAGVGLAAMGLVAAFAPETLGEAKRISEERRPTPVEAAPLVEGL